MPFLVEPFTYCSIGEIVFGRNDTQYNDIQHASKNAALSAMSHNMKTLYGEYCYAERLYVWCLLFCVSYILLLC